MPGSATEEGRRGPLWLKITGRAGVKEFMKQELGI